MGSPLRGRPPALCLKRARKKANARKDSTPGTSKAPRTDLRGGSRPLIPGPLERILARRSRSYKMLEYGTFRRQRMRGD
jgi:hypothetical protein